MKSQKILLFVIILTNMSINLSIYSNQFTIVGHRGASGYEPENTLRSFKRAINMGVSTIELDVYLAKSGEVVVMHDDTIDRTTNGKGNVKDLSLRQLRKYDAGKGEHVPLLCEVFDLVNKRVVIIVEIKDTDATKPVADLIQEYIKNRGWSADNFIVSSFKLEILKEFHKYYPQIRIAALFEKEEKNPIKLAKEIDADFVNIDYRSATKSLVKQAHKENLKILAYTVNSKSEAQKLKKMGFDGIFSNFPDIDPLVPSVFRSESEEKCIEGSSISPRLKK